MSGLPAQTRITAFFSLGRLPPLETRNPDVSVLSPPYRHSSKPHSLRFLAPGLAEYYCRSCPLHFLPAISTCGLPPPPRIASRLPNQHLDYLPRNRGLSPAAPVALPPTTPTPQRGPGAPPPWFPANHRRRSGSHQAPEQLIIACLLAHRCRNDPSSAEPCESDDERPHRIAFCEATFPRIAAANDRTTNSPTRYNFATRIKTRNWPRRPRHRAARFIIRSGLSGNAA